MFGRRVMQPRYQVWMGDAGAAYRYSGTLFQPEPWDMEIQTLCRRLCEDYDLVLNSVLCNLYEDGAHSMGWHADDEPELGERPDVVSLSLGSARRFVLKNRAEPTLKVEYALGQGDLLIMRGGTQANWLHAVPKTRRPVGPRINLTFRRVLSVQ